MRCPPSPRDGVKDATYLRINIIDLVDGSIDITLVNRMPDLNSSLNRLILHDSQACFFREFHRCVRVPMTDKVIHNQEINVSTKPISIVSTPM